MLPVFRRFSQADVPTAPNWITNIFGPLNTFCEQTVQTLNKNLIIGQNVQGMKYTTSFTTLSTYSTTFTPITFQYTGGGQPNCCLIGQITRSDGAVITTPAMISNWYLNINTSPYTVTINYIAGLTANTKYNITFVVL
jgi:hypothetical protein